jgi:hypothetical protein
LLLLLYELVAEDQGASGEQLRGTVFLAGIGIGTGRAQSPGGPDRL